VQVFLSILLVSLASVGIVGVAARSALSVAFQNYLAGLPEGSGPGRGRMGRLLLGAAEQAFVSGVDRSVILAGIVAVAIAAVVSLMLAAYLALPLRRLEAAAGELAGGDLSHRVDVDGPVEVAALSEAFNSMADSLERAESLRRRLTADVAHELRNPLAAARAQAEGMVDGILAPDASRLASLVEDLSHLSALIDDLRELAVAEAGHMSYERERLDLSALARSEATRAEALLDDDVEMVLDLPGGVEVDADERRIAQVFRNLLSNAARHTRRGSVSVSVMTADGYAVVRVTDTGTGVDPADLPHIFERFYRADAARASDTGGAGLGLAISRAIVVDHGGEVFARSESGSGTTMGFRLPLAGQANRATT
jgi:signal transduction histidine kinase